MVVNIRWIKQPFNSELGEFKRVVSDFSDNDPKVIKENLNAIRLMYSKSFTLTQLNDATWKKVENTDSWVTTTLELMQKAIRTNSIGSGTRSIDGVIKEYFTGVVRAPIILQYGAGYTLVAGNTRLMFARVAGITPKVILIKSDW